MIFDSIAHADLYTSVHPRFAAAFAFIGDAIADDLPVGKYEIDGKNLYASVQEYDSKAPEKAKNEGHRNYIDIQVVVSGAEIIEVEDISDAILNSPYNEEKDVEFYVPSPDACRLNLMAGDFAILFPHDVHRPGMAVEESEPVKKIVVKVKAD
ncbi:MAG: YhcH/YjgK/YiaL family protein [Clostridia bacterium]|nr:YhcH/YjgK/YiaL family protein [Clostridia bacterium]